MHHDAAPVIDTHHHIWMRRDIPWLADPAPPRMFGDYFGLRRDYPVEEWMNDVAPAGVVKSVHVTANWGIARALDETRWLQSIADTHGFPHGIVFQADMADPDLETRIKAHKQFPNVRGVRHQLYWDSHPLRQSTSRPDLCAAPELRRGFALLEKHDLHFELQVFAAQAPYAVELLRTFPDIRFILLHSGMLTERTPQAIEQWRAALMAIAACPNVQVKISGLGMFSMGWTPAQLRQVIRDTIQIFGVGRTIFGSNFPLEKLHAGYADLLAAYRAVLAEYPRDDRRRVLHDNAARFYRL
ncbi:MAG: amidohydrolase family protein [Proteobacteria bacterium]|nr:amidohydrolase family protein [Pseudomonadota bacterium]